MHCGIFLVNGKKVKEFPKEWKNLQASFRNPIYWKLSEAEIFDGVVLEGETPNSRAISEFYMGHKVPVYWVLEDGSIDFGDRVPVIKKDFNGIQEGMWAGEDVVIIGGGPSVKQIPQSFFEGKKIIGINRAFEFFKCDIAFGTDRRWLQWIADRKYGDEATECWRTFKGKKVILRGSKYPLKDASITVFDPFNSAVKFSPSLEQGLTRSSNSGISTINLAILLGAKRIYLAGYDSAKTTSGMQEHFHTGHPEKQKDNIFEKFIESANLFAPQIPDNVEVLNMNPDSGIKCFPFYTNHLQAKPQGPDSPPTKPTHTQQGSGNTGSFSPLFVSAYTPDYASLAALLEGDLEKFNLEHEIIPLEDTGKWAENCNLKSYVMKCVREEYPDKVLVWIDADARIEKPPVLFAELNGADVAFHKVDNKTLASGTLAFMPTENGNKLLEMWAEECIKNPRHLDQNTLARCVDVINPKVHKLPETYCRIFDRKTPCKNPVIVHYQESRKRKKREKVAK